MDGWLDEGMSAYILTIRIIYNKLLYRQREFVFT